MVQVSIHKNGGREYPPNGFECPLLGMSRKEFPQRFDKGKKVCQEWRWHNHITWGTELIKKWRSDR